MRTRLAFWIFLAPVLVWLLLLIVLPHLDLLIMSFRGKNPGGDPVWTWGNYQRFFSEPIYWRTFVRTALYSVITTAITFCLAMPVAFYIAKAALVRMRGFLLTLLLLPFWVSELVRIYGWMILLRESGVINYFLMSLGLTCGPLWRRRWASPASRTSPRCRCWSSARHATSSRWMGALAGHRATDSTRCFRFFIPC